MKKMMLAILVVCMSSIGFGACGGGDDESGFGGVSGGKTVADLTNQDKQDICEAQVNKHSSSIDSSMSDYCHMSAAGMLMMGDKAACEAAYDACMEMDVSDPNVEEIDPVASCVEGFDYYPTGCAATVSELVACWEAEASAYSTTSMPDFSCNMTAEEYAQALEEMQTSEPGEYVMPEECKTFTESCEASDDTGGGAGSGDVQFDYDCTDTSDACAQAACAMKQSYDAVQDSCTAEIQGYCDAVTDCIKDYLGCFEQACPSADTFDAEGVSNCASDYTTCATNASAELG